MLSKFDDYPIHQTAEPVFHTASSDRFVYDRYWYNAHARDGSFYFGVALCRYANLGILDGGLSLAIDGRQYAFHASRRAPDEPTDLSIGPFQLHGAQDLFARDQEPIALRADQTRRLDFVDRGGPGPRHHVAVRRDDQHVVGTGTRRQKALLTRKVALHPAPERRVKLGDVADLHQPGFSRLT